jgi:hypothetical protein
MAQSKALEELKMAGLALVNQPRSLLGFSEDGGLTWRVFRPSQPAPAVPEC